MTLTPPIPHVVSDCSPQALEWGRFLEMLAGYAQSSTGRAWLLGLGPSADVEWIRREHALAWEMRRLIEAGVRPSLGSLLDPSEALAKSRIAGAALEADEIRRVLALGEDISAWAALMAVPPAELADALPELREMAGELLTLPLRPLIESLRSRILPDGSLADNASPELRRIRREMERQQRAIEESLRSALRRFSEGGTTQDDLITIRGERFVIPVKAEWKRRVQGVVHGTSSSGQTVYVEPLETIELNNDLVRLLEDEQAEIHRIFAEMTRQIGQYAPVILKGAEVLAEVDTLQARARFAVEFRCVEPRMDVEGAEFRLREARHPLLEKRLRNTIPPFAAASAAKDGAPGVVASGKGAIQAQQRGLNGAPDIVPISVALTSDARQLIISGPNTGGKTVGLKTAGLLAIMAQSGVPVPAEEAVLPVFDAMLADIGDAQSIEQNLSTFSAHIVNLNRISEQADSSSLVLLDELGSATDPEEGAALAVAIAEHFLRVRAWTIISTHHTSLKVYAANTPGVINAAVGFDERTLAPTYELRQGVPGVSAGINIAARLGLDTKMIEAARSRLSTQTQDIGRFIDSLHEQLRAATAERERLDLLERELSRERARLEVEGMKEQRAKVRELEQKLESLLKDFEYRARETVKAIDDRAAQQKLSKEAERRISRLRREFAESFNSAVVAHHTGADKGDQNAAPHIVRHVSAGDMVKLRAAGGLGGKTARVERQIDDKMFEVSVGAMKMRVARDEIAEVMRTAAAETPLQAARSRRGVSVSVADPDESLGWEINVIGRTAGEAQDEVEKFLDRAFLAGLPRVRIIHGTGMGILRRTLREYLRQHPQVASVTEPPQNEGGAGATVVEFKQ
ncbi:MAG: endonuclease MutS2 [Silvibacterium sp.]|nr:endonuclease MutS2 [Silvibacterium sp.]